MNSIERKTRRSEIARLAATGASLQELTSRFDVCGQTIYNACREHGVPTDSLTNHAATLNTRKNRRQEIARAVASGEHSTDVAALFGVGMSTVREACAVHHVHFTRTKRRTFEILAALFDTTKTFTSIGDQFGVSKQNVHQIYSRAKQAGIPVPDRT